MGGHTFAERDILADLCIKDDGIQILGKSFRQGSDLAAEVRAVFIFIEKNTEHLKPRIAGITDFLDRLHHSFVRLE